MFCTCCIKHNTLLKPLEEFWDWDRITAVTNVHTHTHNTTVTVLRPFSFLMKLCLWGVWRTGGHTGSGWDKVSLLIRAVWGSLEPMSVEIISFRCRQERNNAYVCVPAELCENCLYSIYYQSRCMLCNSPLLLILDFFKSVSSPPWQSHVNSLIQQLMTC